MQPLFAAGECRQCADSAGVMLIMLLFAYIMYSYSVRKYIYKCFVGGSIKFLFITFLWLRFVGATSTDLSAERVEDPNCRQVLKTYKSVVRSAEFKTSDLLLSIIKDLVTLIRLQSVTPSAKLGFVSNTLPPSLSRYFLN